jgi:hypothetical protein
LDQPLKSRVTHDFSETGSKVCANERVGVVVSICEMQLERCQLARQRPDKSNLVSTVPALRDDRLMCLMPLYVIDELANAVPKHTGRVGIKP